MSIKSNFIKNIFFAALFTFVFFLVTFKVYRLPFSYGDDHRLLAMLHPEKVSDSYKTTLYGYIPDLKGSLAIDIHNGRFKPLSWSYGQFLCIICGDNIHFFRLSNLVLLFLCAFFLLGIFTCLGVDKLSALMVLAIYVFGRNSEVWWTLGPLYQNIGELFLLAGIYCWLLYRKKGTTGLYVLPALLFFLSGLTKECFNFGIPILLLTDYLFFNPSGRFFAKEYFLSLLASFLVFLCLLITVLFTKKIYAYPYPESALSIIGYNAFQFAGAAGFFLAPIVWAVTGRKFIEKTFLIKTVSVFGIWTLIQLVLLKGIKLDDQHHYLIPWLIYPLILTAMALNKIRNNISGRWYAPVLALYCLAALLFIKNTFVNSSAYSASLQAYYKMMDAIKKDISAPEVVYLSNKACPDDWTEGTRMIMDNAGIRKELYFATTVKSVPAWESDFAKRPAQNAYKHTSPDSIFKPDGKWIILVETPAKNGIMDDSILFYKRKDSGFVKINKSEKYIHGTYFYFSVPYTDASIGNILRGNLNGGNRIGFYGIKMNAVL